MKIKLSYKPTESDRAAAVILALSQLYPFRQKTTPEKDGFLHVYITLREPFPDEVTSQETTGNHCSDSEKMV